MSRGRKFALGLVIVVVLAATVGCTKFLNYFREKHPDPPPGAFPPLVGKMVLEVNERWGKNPNCTRADPLHCWGYYVDPGGDSETTRIHYYMQIYDSPDEAKAALEAQGSDPAIDRTVTSWEEGGQKVGRLLKTDSVRRDDDQILGYCSLSYAKGALVITIYHGYECDPARQFMNDLVAITE